MVKYLNDYEKGLTMTGRMERCRQPLAISYISPHTWRQSSDNDVSTVAVASLLRERKMKEVATRWHTTNQTDGKHLHRGLPTWRFRGTCIIQRQQGILPFFVCASTKFCRVSIAFGSTPLLCRRAKVREKAQTKLHPGCS